MLRIRCARSSLPVLVFVLAAAGLAAAEPSWPQFRGPGRDGKSPETGLLGEWPPGGPKLLWKASGLGAGYSSLAIAGGRIFTMGDRSEEQLVIALDLATRKEVWASRVGGAWEDGGPRSTPTVDGDLLFALGTHGDLVCLEAPTGKERWRKSLPQDFGGTMMSGWGYSESVLVDGDTVICTPGGPEAAIVALDRGTGKTLWKSAIPPLGDLGKDGAGYSSAIAADLAGRRQYVQLLGRGVVGVDAKDGRFLWGYNDVANDVANITSPVASGDLVFATTSYGTGSACLRIVADGDRCKAEEVWFNDSGKFQNHHGGVVLVDGYIYGGSGQNQGFPRCVELSTGKVLWKDEAKRGPPGSGGSAAVAWADGKLYFRYDNGLVALIDARPEGYAVKGTFSAEKHPGPAWAHPVILGGNLFIRGHDSLHCYEIRA